MNPMFDVATYHDIAANWGPEAAENYANGKQKPQKRQWGRRPKKMGFYPRCRNCNTETMANGKNYLARGYSLRFKCPECKQHLTLSIDDYEKLKEGVSNA